MVGNSRADLLKSEPEEKKTGKVHKSEKSSLLFKSKKSDKPGLNQGRVEKMMRLIERRYGNDWDIKTLTSKVNQKCRDKK